MNKYTGAESIDYVIDKFKTNDSLRRQLKDILKQTTQRIYIEAQKGSTFCHRFKIPHGLPNKLYGAFGVQPEKIKKDYEALGFHTNRMYVDPYYQTTLLIYLIGLYSNDEELRKLALFITLIKLKNGMVMKYFKHGCKDEIAEHIIAAKMTGKHIYKTNTPLEVVAYFIDTLDNKYADEIKHHPKTKLLRLFAQAWGRLNQLYKKTAQMYYQSHMDKDYGGSIKVVDSDESGNIRINDQLLHNTVEALVNKFEHAIMIKKLDMPLSEKQYLAKKLVVTTTAIDKIINYLNDQENENEIKMQLTDLLYAVKLQNETDLHKLPTFYTVEKITSKKGDQYIQSLKNYVDGSLKVVFGEMFIQKISATQQLKLRKLYLAILFYMFKRIIIKEDKFERTMI